MFLTESPPRITRRSRIEHWVLLLLRAAAIILLALAFARPFFREATNLDLSNIHGRRVALLVDHQREHASSGCLEFGTPASG